MTILGTMHAGVFARRVRVLAAHLGELAPRDAHLLDVGCGDGTIDSLLAVERPDLRLEGLDVLARTCPKIPLKLFDGKTLPHPDRSFDAVMFVDVLHHTSDPMILLREAARVARSFILIKDHVLAGPFAAATLRMMDWVGNDRYGVALPYNYWSREEWMEAFDALSLRTTEWRTRLALYPGIADRIFGRSLHFIAKLEVPPSRAPAR